MIVDLEKTATESGWFDLEGGGKVRLRLFDTDDLEAMRKLCIATTAEYPLLDIDPNDPLKGKRYQRFEAPKFDVELWELEANDRSILGWEDIFDRNEKPIPVTRENKTLLMQRVPKFASAVNEARKVLQERDRQRAEDSEKNLSSG